MITAATMSTHLRTAFASDARAPHVFKWKGQTLTVGRSPVNVDERVVDEGDYKESEAEITIIREDLADPNTWPQNEDVGTLDGEDFYVLRHRFDDVSVVVQLKRNE